MFSAKMRWIGPRSLGAPACSRPSAIAPLTSRLQLERNRAQAEHRDGQDGQSRLMDAGESQNVAHDGVGHGDHPDGCSPSIAA